MSSTTPKEFFTTYVALRRPVVLEGYFQDEAHAGSLHKWMSDLYLLKKAGDAEVRITLQLVILSSPTHLQHPLQDTDQYSKRGLRPSELRFTS
jgi:hypothetical protein